ncbi:11-beta-hydroxysteroid dehydrogenase 1A-like isoform X2 [Euphorbia lathyris]|uniref:11-beta-hydroxysteroid dehydrogenase 1A-like isoform X2 n=1 Tax=Euphorbia lathyris TaxID=212925 RepID=UPI00331311BF
MESLSEAELGEDCRECAMLGLLSVEEMRQQVLRFLNLNCSFVTGSISLSQSLCSIQDTVGDTDGGRAYQVDHLVNNVGISSISLLEEATDITNFRTIMDTNFWGSAYTSRFAIPYLRRSRGKIIALYSSASWLPQPRKSIYNASKATMVIFFETLRVELGSNVDVLIVTPGFIESEVTQGKFLLLEGKVDVDQALRNVGKAGGQKWRSLSLAVLDSRGHLLVALGYGLWPSMVISEIVQTFTLADFCYYYIKSVFRGLLVLRLPLGVV